MWTRREFVERAGAAAGSAIVGGGLLELLAACSSGSSQSASALPQGSRNLEVFSSWTSGGEADGLAEMFRIFTQKHAGVRATNAAVTGIGSNAGASLAGRMGSGKPPDSFQVRAGQALTSTWVKADKMEPVTGIWHQAGWDRVIPRELREIVSAKGEIWSVPVDIHRGNAMWVSTQALGAAGGQVPETLDAFITMLERARQAGIAEPLALGSRNLWPVAMLFENGILASGGADYFRHLFSGRGSFTDSKVKEALAGMAAMLEYVNRDHGALDWDEAAGRLVTNPPSALATIMGDWAKGYFAGRNQVPGRDFAGLPSPGSRGNYVVVCDTFALPRGAPDRDNAVNWLKVCGSAEGQAALNPRKGSIPARTDVAKSLFDPIAQQFMDDFRSARLVPSSAHGSATPEAFSSALNGLMGEFCQKRDVNATAFSLQSIAHLHLKP